MPLWVVLMFSLNGIAWFVIKLIEGQYFIAMLPFVIGGPFLMGMELMIQSKSGNVDKRLKKVFIDRRKKKREAK